MNDREKKIIDFLTLQGDVAFAYLFGSALKGFFNKESDIDIAVYLSQNKKDFFERRLELIDALSKICQRAVDVLILNRTSSLLLKFSIIAEGKCIYESDSLARKQFELETLSCYYDYQPVSKMYELAYIQKHL